MIIPDGVEVVFDTTGASGLADTSAEVQVDNIGTNGGLDIKDGNLEVAQKTEVKTLIQSGGELATNSLEVTESFEQTGSGTIDVATDATINQTTGATQLGDLVVGGDFDVTAQGDITQLADTSVAITGATTATSTTGDIALDGENDFKNTLHLEGKDVVVNDINSLEFGDVATSGSLEATAQNDITQKDDTTITTEGTTTLASTSGDIALDAENDFKDKVTAEGKDVTLNDVNDLDADIVATAKAYNRLNPVLQLRD